MTTEDTDRGMFEQHREGVPVPKEAALSEARAWSSALEARANVLGAELKRPGVADRFAEEGRHHELATSAHLIARLADALTSQRTTVWREAMVRAAGVASAEAQETHMDGEIWVAAKIRDTLLSLKDTPDAE